MSNTIRIKRRSYDSPAGAGAPSSMVNAEIAFNEVDRTLYYGFGNWGGESESILAIAGPGSFVTLNTNQTITGNKTFANNVTITGTTVFDDLSLNGGDLSSNSAIFNLLNEPYTINFGLSANTLTIGATSGITTIRNNVNVDGWFLVDGESTFTGVVTVANNAVVSGNLNVNGGTLDSSSSSFTLLPSPSLITLGVSATTVNIGANTGITNIKNNVDVDGTFSVDGYASLLNGASLNNKRIENLADPINAQDAATKAYVDAARAGLDPKASVKLIATSNTALSGVSTLIDGNEVLVGDRILVVGQDDSQYNGIYIASETDWERSFDANSSSSITSGLFTYVEDGDEWASSSWVLTTTGTITPDVTELTFVQFASAGQTIAGNGLTKSGNTIDVNGTTDRITVNASAVDIASTYVGQTSITTLGTISSGSWNADTISTLKGGTGLTTYTKGDILYASATNTLSKLTIGANTALLQVSSDGTIQWTLTIDGGEF